MGVIIALMDACPERYSNSLQARDRGASWLGPDICPVRFPARPEKALRGRFGGNRYDLSCRRDAVIGDYEQIWDFHWGVAAVPPRCRRLQQDKEMDLADISESIPRPASHSVLSFLSVQAMENRTQSSQHVLQFPIH